MSKSLSVSVNGEPQVVEPGMSVTAWLAAAKRDPRSVAIELNGEILPRERYPETVFSDGDSLEVVQFVQGG